MWQSTKQALIQELNKLMTKFLYENDEVKSIIEDQIYDLNKKLEELRRNKY